MPAETTAAAETHPKVEVTRDLVQKVADRVYELWLYTLAVECERQRMKHKS